MAAVSIRSSALLRTSAVGDAHPPNAFGIVMSIAQLRAAYLRQPQEISIETLALCNAACTFCPYPTLERIGTKMDDALLFDLIDQMASWQVPFFVSPFKVNEPLLDTRMAGLCRRIVEFCPAAMLRLFTNGSTLVAKQLDWIQALPEERIDTLWVSLNSTDPGEYAQLMQLKYEPTAKRLDALHERKFKREFPHIVVVSRVAQASEGSEAHQARDEAFIKGVTARWPLFEPVLIKRDGWLGYVDPMRAQIPAGPCGRWFELNIMATGRAALCCMDGKGEYAVGDVRTMKLLDIYNQPHLLHRREFAITRKGVDPCERCTY